MSLTKIELIDEAKNYLEDVILAQNLSPLNDNNFRHSVNKIPLWEKAIVKKISIGNAVIVPIKYDKELLLKNESGAQAVNLERTSYLIIYRDKKQNMKIEWVTLMPSEKIVDRKFIGIVNVEK